tara:strand:- start:1623 stop:2024 length:402 start_codon:yes stop_codon:yes gene_type:complete
MNIKREDSIVHAIKELYPEHATIDFKSPNEFIVYDNNMNIISVDLNAVKEKAIVHERDVLPVNLIRTERKMLLESTDWEVQRNNEMGIDNTNLLEYRKKLRNLPQDIANETIEKPYLDSNNQLVFNDWPTKPE